MGSAKRSTGFTHAAIDSPEVNHTVISLSRKLRVSVSSTATNAAIDSSTRHVGEDPERDEADHRLGQHLAAGRLAEQQDQQPREDEREQHRDHGKRHEAEFANEAAFEDHGRGRAGVTDSGHGPGLL